MQATYTDFALDQTNVSILGPLQPYKQYVNVYQGFQYPGAAATHTGIVNCLSGSTATDTTTPRTTVEQVIGKALGVKPLILGACSHLPFGLDANGMLFWDGTPIDPAEEPGHRGRRAVRRRRPPRRRSTPTCSCARICWRFTASEIQGLQNTLAGLTSEQTKLATHLASIQALQADSSVSRRSRCCTTKPTLPTVEMVRAASAGTRRRPERRQRLLLPGERTSRCCFKAQLEVVTQAIICNAAPIIGAHADVRDLRLRLRLRGRAGRAPQRPVAHAPRSGRRAPRTTRRSRIDNLDPARRAYRSRPRSAGSRQQLVEQRRQRARHHRRSGGAGDQGPRQHAHLLMSEIGDGQDHNRVSEIEYPQVPDSLPLVTIGKCGGAIKSGQVVQFPTAEHARTRRAWSIDRPATST